MKKNYLTTLLAAFFAIVLLSGCEEKLTLEKCETLILAHPFFKEKHVGVSDKQYPDCEDAYLGCVKGGYVNLRGRDTDAYYYTLYGFGIKDVEDLLVEEKKASCSFKLIEKDKTSACRYNNDNRITGEYAPCMARFTKYEEGWKLDGILCEDHLFMINVWRGKGVQPYVNFDSFK